MPKLLHYGRSPPPTSNDVQIKTIREYLADILPTEVLLMVILLAILIFMISVFVYKLVKQYKNDHTKLTLRLTSDHISFECLVGYLRYSCTRFRLLNLEIKKIEIALSSNTWSVTWHSVFGEGDVCWVPDQWKERTVTPGYVFVSNSSVTVGLDSVFKSYIKRRLDCDDEDAVCCTPPHVCMFVYFGDLECQNIQLFWANSDFSYRPVTTKIY